MLCQQGSSRPPLLYCLAKLPRCSHLRNRGFVIFLGSTVSELFTMTPVLRPAWHSLDPQASTQAWIAPTLRKSGIWNQSLRESEWRGAGSQDGQGDTACWLPSGAGELPESEPTEGHRHRQCLCQ